MLLYLPENMHTSKYQVLFQIKDKKVEISEN